MAAFAGIVRFDGAVLSKSIEDQLRRAVTALQKGQVSTRRIDGAVFAQRLNSAVRSQRLERPWTSAGGVLVAGDAILDNRDEVADLLAIPRGEAAGLSDATLIYRAFEERGEYGLACCLGDFAIACWNPSLHRLTLARDCQGYRALFFHRGPGFAAFASTLQGLMSLPGVPRELDEDVLANYLALNLGEPCKTFFRGIERVPSRTLLVVESASLECRPYWSPDFEAPPPFQNEGDYIERARELLDSAVASFVRGTSRIAISASGGLDSSAIAATAARLRLPQPIVCYTLAPPGDLSIDPGPFKYLDERPKMEALRRMHPALELRFVTPERPHRYEWDSREYFARSALPVLNPSNFGWFSNLYDAIRDDSQDVLLNGARGNLGLTWSGRFSLVALLGSGSWRAFANEVAAVSRRTRRNPLRVLGSEVVIRGGPDWIRRFAYRAVKGDPDSPAHFSALSPEYLLEAGLVGRWRERGFNEPWFGTTGRDPARIRARWLFDYNQFARDAAAMASELHGFAIRAPLGDRRLLEFLLRVPEPLYRRNGQPRSFARHVLSDRLPPEIISETRSGYQSAGWFRRLSSRRAEIMDELEALQASPLAARIIDLPRLRRLASDWPADEQAAETRKLEFHIVLDRGLHVGRFIRWVEGGNA